MKHSLKLPTTLLVASAAVALGLAGCGGGGGDAGGSGSGNAGVTVAVNGTVARGAMLAGAAVNMTCANSVKLSGATTANGTFAISSSLVAYPCIGTAVAGAITYRGVLSAGAVMNFTPLTDLLVQAMLAAAGSGTASLTIEQFVARITTDATFASSVSSPANTASYRKAVLDTVRTELIASGKTDAEVTTILAAAATFESTVFGAGSALDQTLDDTGSALLNTDGMVRSAVHSGVKAAADLLPAPAAGATGATGG